MLNVALKRCRTLPLGKLANKQPVVAAASFAATATAVGCFYFKQRRAGEQADASSSTEVSGVRAGVWSRSVRQSITDRHGVLCHSVPTPPITGADVDIRTAACPMTTEQQPSSSVGDDSSPDKCPHETSSSSSARQAEKVWSEDEIHKLVESKPVVLFMKGDPENPKCRFSKKMIQLLQRENIDFLHVNVLDDANLRQRVKEIMEWPTYPQLYCHGDIVGGLDEVQNILRQRIKLRAFLGIE